MFDSKLSVNEASELHRINYSHVGIKYSMRDLICDVINYCACSCHVREIGANDNNLHFRNPEKTVLQFVNQSTVYDVIFNLLDSNVFTALSITLYPTPAHDV